MDINENQTIDLTEKDSNNSIKTIESTESKNDNSIIEYQEIEEPCVALTIIGKNKLTNAGIFVRRGIRYSIKAFFSTIVLTIVNMFM